MKIASASYARAELFDRMVRPGFTINEMSAAIGLKRSSVIHLLSSGIVDVFHGTGRITIARSFPEARAITVRRGEKVIRLLNEADPNERGELIVILENAVRGYDQASYLHQKRVSLQCKRMADLIGLAGSEREDLVLAARLHDFGKIGVPSHLINTGTSFFNETGLYLKKFHLYYALWTFEKVKWLKRITEILTYSHLFDGYPPGLSFHGMGTQSQIISAADYFDALTNQRPYRDPISAAAALEEVGKRPYDQKVIDALERSVR